MIAYMIIACKMHDREKFISTYGKLVPSLVEKYGGEYLIVAPGANCLRAILGDMNLSPFLNGHQKNMPLDFGNQLNMKS